MCDAANFDPGITTPLNVLNLLPDNILFSLAHVCDIEMGDYKVEQPRNLTFIRELESLGLKRFADLRNRKRLDIA